MLLIIIFTIAVLPIIILQTGLALGAPWGKLAMGGKFGDVFSPKLRISALIQLLIIVCSFVIVLVRGEVFFAEYFLYSKIAIWFVVALYFLSAILNMLAASKYERMLGVPAALMMCVSSLLLALGYY